MAQFTHSVGIVYKNDAGSITSTTDSYIDNAEVNIDLTVPNASTNLAITVPNIVVANVKSMVLFSSKDVTLAVNSSSTPAPSISVTANKQIVWTEDHLEVNPFTSSPVTKFYVTNASGADAAFKFRCLLHET